MSADQGGSYGAREDGDSLLSSQIKGTLDIVFIFYLCITNKKKKTVSHNNMYLLSHILHESGV